MSKFRFESVSSVIAVGSCKGGVGKTTVSVNLAMAFRRAGLSVGLFDADLYGPNVPLMLGIRRKEARYPMSMTRGTGEQSLSFIPLYRKDQAPYIEPVRRFGLQAMSLGFWFGETEGSKDPSSLGGHLVRQVLRDIRWSEVDILIIDLPPGTGQLMHMLLESIHIDGVVIVTTPQEMSLLDTGRSVEFFRQSGASILGRVENMSYFTCPHCGKKTEVFENRTTEWEVFNDMPFLGSIPLDQSLGRAIDANHPFTQLTPDSVAARAVNEIAGKLREILPGKHKRRQ